MRQSVLLSRIPRHLCTQGATPPPHESRARCRARHFNMFLRSPPSSMRAPSFSNLCSLSLQKEQQDARLAALASDANHSDSNLDPSKLSSTNKTARAYAKTYKPGPPLVPAIIVGRISKYIGKMVRFKKLELLLMMCRYWSLKREARRGAPLLKRLHLEPWTVSSAGKVQSEEEKGMRLAVCFSVC